MSFAEHPLRGVFDAIGAECQGVASGIRLDRATEAAREVERCRLSGGRWRIRDDGFTIRRQPSRREGCMERASATNAVTVTEGCGFPRRAAV